MISWFQLIETVAPLIPVIITYILKPPKQKWITILNIYGLIYFPVVAYANYLQSQVISNIGIYVFVTMLTFCAFSLVISFFIGNKTFTFIAWGLIIIISVFSVLNAALWEKLELYNSNSSSLSSILLVIYCLFYYWLQIRMPKNVFISSQPSFWIITGIFIYSGGNFFLFTYYHELCDQALHTPDKVKKAELWHFAEIIWIINDFLILFTNIFFAKAILCTRQK